MNNEKIKIELELRRDNDHKTITIELRADEPIDMNSTVRALSNFIKHTIKKYDLDPAHALSRPGDVATSNKPQQWDT